MMSSDLFTTNYFFSFRKEAYDKQSFKHLFYSFLNTQENTLEALKPGCLGLHPGFVTSWLNDLGQHSLFSALLSLSV